MKLIYKSAIILYLLILTSDVYSQEFFRLKESMGMPLRSRVYNDIKGTPYFVDNWSKGIIKQANGQIFNDIELKYDQLEDEVIYKDINGKELGFAVPVIEFRIDYSFNGLKKSSLFRNGFEPFKGSTEKSYYEILYDGTFKLAKKNVKHIEQYREYNSAVTTKSIIERIKYYYFAKNTLVEFKRDNKSIQQAFGEKAPLILAYIKENDLDLKKDVDLINIFNFYNSL
ncbi:hypothetical protein ACEN2P_07970 [Pedobacter psychrotolerans]|uniref:hypothetical protein n=1 Tax=Pedobacter psychrotolerans TaxID=1843235 RepID=UPI003F9656EE